MDITRFALSNNRITALLIAVVVIWGVQTYNSMPRAYDPGFIIRAAQVITYFPGASPERVENLVSAKIEEAIKEIPELDFVSSESRTGVSIVTANIKQNYKRMRPLWDSLRRKIIAIEPDLPDGVQGPFVNDEFGDVYGVVLTVTGEGFSDAELNHIADDIRDDIQLMSEVAKVDIFGDQEEQVLIEYDNFRLAELNLSSSQLASSLGKRNILNSGGAFDLGNERIALEPSGNFESIEDIQNSIIQIPGSRRALYLKDVATVRRDYRDPPESIVRSSSDRAIAIAVSMRKGGNNIELGRSIKEKIRHFEQVYPWGVEFELVSFSPKEVENKVSSFVESLIQSITIVTIFVLLFLGLRSGLIVASLIPLSMLMAMIVMAQFSIGFNQISLAALIITLGMLVDNGIVMSENILVQMQKGKSAFSAAIDSSKELRLPLLISSLTTSAAFLPIYLAESATGEYTAALFEVVSITLMCSWLIALTVIPLLSVAFLKVKQSDESYDSKMYQRYRYALDYLLQYRWRSLAVLLLVFIVAMQGFKLIPKAFFPPSDRSYFKLEVELPTGASIDATSRTVERMEYFLRSELMAKQKGESGVTHWVSYIGNAGPRFITSHNPKPSRSNYALLLVNVSDHREIDTYIDRILEFAYLYFPDADINARRMDNGPEVANPVEVRLSGRDSDALFKAAAELKIEMARIGGLRNISDDWGQRIKKLRVDIDQERAQRAGVSSEDIAISLQTSLSGVELTQYREGEDVLPIVWRSSLGDRPSIVDVKSVIVHAQSSGLSLPLTQVADVNVVWDDAKILRRNGIRTVTVGAQLTPGTNAAEKFEQLAPWLAELDQSSNYKVGYELGGESESSEIASQSIGAKLPVAGLIILLLLVGQFQSFRKATIVLITIPFGLIGVVSALLVGQSFFGFMTLLGVISLAGIVINNAIVLLERIKLELERGTEAQQAIVNAAVQRARPILLTTATTIVGMLPLYISGGEMWEPLALTIIGGLAFSTVLTLGFVPLLYSLFYRVAR
jgi:multidrug efflux pump subunit AcrB